MNSYFNIKLDAKYIKEFDVKCNVMISKVGKAAKQGTISACKELQQMSLAQVPRHTNTLANSCYYKIDGNWKEGFTGIVGYGGNGDPISPLTGEHASTYMVAVHENLYAQHPIGKAKFLEDPAREFASRPFKRTIFKQIKELFGSLGGSS